MRILVTGGTGFIGSALCQQLLKRGDEVVVLTRDRKSALDVVGEEPALVESPDEVEAGVDAVVNLAGEPLDGQRWDDAFKQRLIASRVDTTRALGRWMTQLDTPPGVLVNGSAIGWYGAQGAHTLDEASDFADGFSHRLCAAWERAAQEAVEGLSTRLCILRIGIVLHPSGGTLKQMKLPFKLGLGGRFGSGEQYMSWIARQDLVRGIEYLIDHKELAGVFNGTAPEPVANREFAAILSNVLDRPNLMSYPAPLMRLAMGEMADELILTGQKVVPEALLEAGFEFRYPDLKSCLRELLGSTSH